jgi:hypothetical protein
LNLPSLQPCQKVSCSPVASLRTYGRTEITLSDGKTNFSYERYSEKRWGMLGETGDTLAVASGDQNELFYMSGDHWVKVQDGEPIEHPHHSGVFLTQSGHWSINQSAEPESSGSDITCATDDSSDCEELVYFPADFIRQNPWIKELSDLVSLHPRLGNGINSVLIQVWNQAVGPPALFLPQSGAIISIINWMMERREDMTLKNVSVRLPEEVPDIHPSLVIQDFLAGRQQSGTTSSQVIWSHISAQPVTPVRMPSSDHGPDVLTDIPFTKTGMDVAQIPFSQSEVSDVWTLDHGGGNKMLFSALCPPGSITAPQADGHLLYKYFIHIAGVQLLVFWPPTERNIFKLCTQHPIPDVRQRWNWPDLASHLEKPEFLYAKEPVEAIIPPFYFCSIVNLAPSVHCYGYFVRPRTLKTNLQAYSHLENFIADRHWLCVPQLLEDSIRWFRVELDTVLSGKLESEDFYRLNQHLTRRYKERLEEEKKKCDEESFFYLVV